MKTESYFCVFYQIQSNFFQCTAIQNNFTLDSDAVYFEVHELMVNVVQQAWTVYHSIINDEHSAGIIS